MIFSRFISLSFVLVASSCVDAQSTSSQVTRPRLITSDGAMNVTEARQMFPRLFSYWSPERIRESPAIAKDYIQVLGAIFELQEPVPVLNEPTSINRYKDSIFRGITENLRQRAGVSSNNQEHEEPPRRPTTPAPAPADVDEEDDAPSTPVHRPQPVRNIERNTAPAPAPARPEAPRRPSQPSAPRSNSSPSTVQELEIENILPLLLARPSGSSQRRVERRPTTPEIEQIPVAAEEPEMIPILIQQESPAAPAERRQQSAAGRRAPRREENVRAAERRPTTRRQQSASSPSVPAAAPANPDRPVAFNEVRNLADLQRSSILFDESHRRWTNINAAVLSSAWNAYRARGNAGTLSRLTSAALRRAKQDLRSATAARSEIRTLLCLENDADWSDWLNAAPMDDRDEGGYFFGPAALNSAESRRIPLTCESEDAPPRGPAPESPASGPQRFPGMMNGPQGGMAPQQGMNGQQGPMMPPQGAPQMNNGPQQPQQGPGPQGMPPQQQQGMNGPPQGMPPQQQQGMNGPPQGMPPQQQQGMNGPPQGMPPMSQGMNGQQGPMMPPQGAPQMNNGPQQPQQVPGPQGMPPQQQQQPPMPQDMNGPQGMAPPQGMPQGMGMPPGMPQGMNGPAPMPQQQPQQGPQQATRSLDSNNSSSSPNSLPSPQKS